MNESDNVKERFKQSVVAVLRDEYSKIKEPCDICEDAGIVLWRIKELEKNSVELKQAITDIKSTMSSLKNVLIATLTSVVLTLIMVIAMYATQQ